MWVSVHAFSGLALGASGLSRQLGAAGVVLLVVGALALHLLLDLVPHWDYTRHRLRIAWVALDLGVAVLGSAGLIVGLGLSWHAALGAAISALPDLDVLDSVLPWKRGSRWFPSHWKAFPHGRSGPVFGISVQAVVVAASLASLAFTKPTVI
jgi:hypothetical protein